MELSYRDDLGALEAVERVHALCPRGPRLQDRARDPFCQDILEYPGEYLKLLMEIIPRYDPNSAIFFRCAEALGFLCTCLGTDPSEIEFPNGTTVQALIAGVHAAQRVAQEPDIPAVPEGQEVITMRIPWRAIIVCAILIAFLASFHA
ncbi:MAG TPA: hypothetical protein VFL98_01710 [Candidatus Paceibacterota bacterium]|nr:hypothetical protein [Candidatus Paceibacterota bacterium]